MKVYKIVRNIDNVLFSAVVNGTHQKVYAKDGEFFNVENVLCFIRETSAERFCSQIWHTSTELWEADADNFMHLDMVVSLSFLNEFTPDKLLYMLKEKFVLGKRSYYSVDAPSGTILCENMKLTRRIK